MPCSSAAAIDSASRIEPPGWMTDERARLGRLVDAVAEREEGVGGDRRTGQRRARLARRRSAPSRRATSGRRRSPSVRPSAANTMAFDLTCLQTRQAKSQIAQLGGRGRALGDDLGVGRRRRVAIARLDQEAARHAAQLDGARRVAGRSRREQAEVLLGRQQHQRLRRERRRDDALEERLGELPTELSVDRAIHRHDAAEGRDRIGLPRPAIRLGDARLRDGGAAGRVVLDDGGGRFAELGAEAQRRVEVQKVVVGELLALKHLGARQRWTRRLERRRRPPSGAGSRRSAGRAPASPR